MQRFLGRCAVPAILAIALPLPALGAEPPCEAISSAEYQRTPEETYVLVGYTCQDSEAELLPYLDAPSIRPPFRHQRAVPPSLKHFDSSDIDASEYRPLDEVRRIRLPSPRW